MPTVRIASTIVAWACALAAAAASAQDARIEDNSFFVEEAYNQEPGVVQHISNLVHFPGEGFSYTFTQEWPVPGVKHQLSYTLPVSWGTPGGWLGDIVLNYRYQLAAHDAWAAVAPRLSLILATGGERRKAPGLQMSLPASKRLGRELAVHADLGATLLPGDLGHVASAAASVVGPVERPVNLMLEAVVSVQWTRDTAGTSLRSTQAILSPGVRFAIDIGRLQIVPGLGVPVRFGGGTKAGLFAYLSFEHPFRKVAP